MIQVNKDMWSSNLLLALSLQKLNREKRERQPNWTESEKQMLLSLTRMHKSILENKGSDTMTIKRKSEAWDDIAMRMKTAGFNRSKERLKQQLGRIRSADAKRSKDIMEKRVPSEQSKSLNDYSNFSLTEENIKNLKSHFSDYQINHIRHYTTPLPTSLSLQEIQYIKSEDPPPIEENNCFKEEIQTNSYPCNIKPNIINYSITNTGKDKKKDENTKNPRENMQFQLQSVHSLAEIDSNVGIEAKGSICIVESKVSSAGDVTSTIPSSTLSSSMQSSAISCESNQISNGGSDENATPSFPAGKCKKQQQNKRSLLSNRIRTSFTREHGLQQLYMYRVAVERERLRSLRLQQKRDRILYRKDIQLQNLKLQILQNLTNPNRESSSINF